MHKSTVALFAALLVLTSGGLAAQSASPASMGKDIEARTLKNGMKIIVWPDQDIPNVALYNFFNVGSRNERPGITGLSHFFEHMMFNGTKKPARASSTASWKPTAAQQRLHHRRTSPIYQDWFPASGAGAHLRSRSGPHAQPRFRSEGRSRASAASSTRSGARASTTTIRARSTSRCRPPPSSRTRTRSRRIGWPSDIEGWQIDDLRSYFQRYYAPNNATLVVVGAVTPEEVFALADKYLAAIPSHPAPDPVTKEPEQQGERRVIVRKAAQTPLYQEAYHISSGKDADRQTIELLLAHSGARRLIALEPQHGRGATGGHQRKELAGTQDSIRD